MNLAKTGCNCGVVLGPVLHILPCMLVRPCALEPYTELEGAGTVGSSCLVVLLSSIFAVLRMQVSRRVPWAASSCRLTMLHTLALLQTPPNGVAAPPEKAG